MPAKPEPKPLRPTHAKTRLTTADRERLDQSHLRHKTNDTEVLEGLILAYLDAVEREGAVRFPITITMAEPLALVAEEQAPYPEPSPTAVIEAEEASRRYDAARARAARKQRGAGPRKSATGGP